PSAEWGLMVAQGQSALLNGAPWQSLAAGLLIVLVVVGVNTLGERATSASASASASGKGV
ncbi:ABC transporter permease, partial [Streptomyces sp. NPDC002896]